MCDQDPLLLENIVTGDETWCYQFDPGLKRQSMAWCSPTSSRQKESRLQKSKVKTLLFAFFDKKGIIHEEFVPVCQTINVTFYHVVLSRLLKRILRVRPELHRAGNVCCSTIIILYTVQSVYKFLAQKMVAVLDHPPCSPDLAPVGFFLCPRLKAAIKDARFADVSAFKDL